MRDNRGRSPSPKPVSVALDRVLDSIAPQTLLAGVQAAWPRAVGPRIAAATTVTDEHEGIVVVECESAVWAHELEMMTPQLLESLKARLGAEAPQKLRFRASGSE